MGKNRSWKWFAIFLISLIYFSLLVVWNWPDQNLHIVFCDVGQGDAILVSYGFWQMLVDGGPDQLVLECLDDHLPLWDKDIELMVLTHPDSDHMVGLTSVLGRYRVKQLITRGIGKTSAEFKLFRQAVLDEISADDLFVNIIDKEIKIGISDQIRARFWTWPSNGDSPQIWDEHLAEEKLSAILTKQTDEINNLNDLSIVTFLQFNRVNILLTGDLEEAGEAALLNEGLIVDADIIKAGHHGSKSSSSSRFLSLLGPENIIISCGQNNNFGHPHVETLRRFEQNHAQVWRTDQLGTVEIISDGSRYWFADFDQ